jgi:hypothetical protein
MAIFAGIVAGIVTATCIQWLLRDTSDVPTRIAAYPAFTVLMMIVAIGCQSQGMSPAVGVSVTSAIVLGLCIRYHAERVPNIRPADPPEIDAHRELSGLPFEARVQMGSVRGRLVTEFTAAVGGGDFHLHLATRDWTGDVHPDAHLTVVDAIEGPYAVMSNRTVTAIEFLHGAWRDIIAADRLHVGSFLLQVRPGSMLIRAEGAIRERTRFNPFVERAVALARRLHDTLRAPAFEMEVVATGGRCPVCGVALAGAIVHCRRCSTPHHADCWTYNGMCAVYACRGREHSGRPQVALPAINAERLGAHRVEGFTGTQGSLAEPFPALIRNGTLTSAGRTVTYADFRCEIPMHAGLVDLTYRDSRRLLGIHSGQRAANAFGAWEVHEEFPGDAGPRLLPVASAVKAIPDSTLGSVSVSMGRDRLYVPGAGAGPVRRVVLRAGEGVASRVSAASGSALCPSKSRNLPPRAAAIMSLQIIIYIL